MCTDEAAHRHYSGQRERIVQAIGGFKHIKASWWKIQLKDGLRYMLAGKSEFTMLSLKTGERFRYKLLRKRLERRRQTGHQIIFIT